MSERLYSLLLRLYPRAFRERYAQEMARLFRDRRRHENAAWVWLDVLADAVVSIPRQHWVQEPHPLYPPSAAPFRLLRFSHALGGAALGALISVAIAAGMIGGLTHPLFWLAVVAHLSLLLAIRRCAVRDSQLLQSFRAEVSGDAVTVSYQGAAPVTLQRSEVIGLHDYMARGLRIRTANSAHDLWVPARTASYLQMKASLSQWVPLEVTPLISPEAFDITSRVCLWFVTAVGPMPFTYVIGLPLLVTVIADARRKVPVLRRLWTFAGIATLLWRWLGPR